MHGCVYDRRGCCSAPTSSVCSRCRSTTSTRHPHTGPRTGCKQLAQGCCHPPHHTGPRPGWPHWLWTTCPGLPLPQHTGPKPVWPHWLWTTCPGLLPSRHTGPKPGWSYWLWITCPRLLPSRHTGPRPGWSHWLWTTCPGLPLPQHTGPRPVPDWRPSDVVASTMATVTMATIPTPR